MCETTRHLPASFDCTGKHLPFYCSIFNNAYPALTFETLPNGMTANGANPGERLLILFYYNILRHYRRSALFEHMRKHIRQQDVFVDVGAYLGIYSYLSTCLGAMPVTIEANSTCVSFLQKNSLFFPHVHPFSAWDKEEERTFYIGKDINAGASSLISCLKPWSESCYKSETRVRCKPLTSIIPHFMWKKIRILKIDVEGAEEHVLQGMYDELGKHQFHIWCEVRDNTSDRNPGTVYSVCKLLGSKGYTPYIYCGRQFQPFKQNQVRRVFDLLFIPKQY